MKALGGKDFFIGHEVEGKDGFTFKFSVLHSACDDTCFIGFLILS